MGSAGRENLPAALASTVLFGLLGVGVDMARLGEVAGEVLDRQGSTVSEAGVVTIIVFVRLSHYSNRYQHVILRIKGLLDDWW